MTGVELEVVPLGRTGIDVSIAGLGCGGYSKLGQAHGRSFEHSVGLVRTALDAGVTLIDTALAYATEEIVASAIRGRRDGVVLSTKVPIYAGAFTDLANMIDADRLERDVDGCLRRLGVDVIDILHIHAVMASQYDHVCHVLLPRLADMRQAGKIRLIGITERFGTDTTHEMALRAAYDGHVDVLMIGLNFVNQTAIGPLLAATTERGIGTLCMFAVRGPLANRSSAEALLRRLVAIGEVDPATFDPDDPFGFLLQPGVADTLAEAAYRFCRHTPGIDATVTGTGSREHLLENLHSLTKGPLPAGVLRRLRSVFGGVRSVSGDP